MPSRPKNLNDRRLWPLSFSRQHPQRIVALNPKPHPCLGDALPNQWIFCSTIFFRQFDNLVEFILKQHLLPECRDPSLEQQSAVGDFPSTIHIAHYILSRCSRVIEEHFTEFGITGHLDNRADFDARLIHRAKDIRNPCLLRLGVRIRSTNHEAPIRPRRTRGPDLLSVEHPFVAIEHCTSLHIGQIASRPGLGIALTPNIFSRKNRWNKSALEAFIPEMNQSWS